MRELILSMSMSLDGFVSGPAGEVDWIFSDDEQAKAWKLQTVRNASLHIMGSHTFRDMAAFWPTSTMGFAAAMNQIPKAVFSKRGAAVLDGLAARTGTGQPLQAGAESWAQPYIAGGGIVDEIRRLKASGGKPIIAHGGAAFARSLIAHNLVDVYALLVHPIALGQGRPIFAELLAPRRLKRVGSKAFPGGAMAQIYRPG